MFDSSISRSSTPSGKLPANFANSLAKGRERERRERERVACVRNDGEKCQLEALRKKNELFYNCVTRTSSMMCWNAGNGQLEIPSMCKFCGVDATLEPAVSTAGKSFF